jgi:hypothetical protein
VHRYIGSPGYLEELRSQLPPVTPDWTRARSIEDMDRVGVSHPDWIAGVSIGALNGAIIDTPRC